MKEKKRQDLIVPKQYFDVYYCIKYMDKFLQVKCRDISIRPGGRSAHNNHCDSNVYYFVG